MTDDQGSTGRVHYGRTFTAPCSNDLWREDTHGYVACPGTLTFGPDDRDAPCDSCGARCGRLVAFGLPSGEPFPAPLGMIKPQRKFLFPPWRCWVVSGRVRTVVTTPASERSTT